MFQTPNYLGFLQAMPKQSPIEKGMKVYGDIQDLRQKTYETQYMPKKLEQEEEVRQQGLETGQQNIDMNKLILKALPLKLQSEITTQQLNQARTKMETDVQGMTLNQVREGFVKEKLAGLYDMSSRGMDDQIASNQYNRILKQAESSGMDVSTLPKTWGDDAKSLSQFYYNNLPNTVEARKVKEEYYKTTLTAQTDLMKALKSPDKKDDPYFIRQQQDESSADTKYRTSVGNASHIASQNVPLIQSLITVAQNNPEKLGFVAGKFTGKMTAEGAAMVANLSQLVINSISQLKDEVGASALRSVFMEKLVALTKPSINMPYQAYMDILQRFLAESNNAIQFSKFYDFAEKNGVRDRKLIGSAWDDFLGASQSKLIDKQGRFNPNAYNDWSSYFTQNPHKLPPQLSKVVSDQIAQSAQQFNVVNTGGLITPYQGEPTKALGWSQ